MGLEEIFDEVFALHCRVVAAKDFLMKLSQQLAITRAKGNRIYNVITH
jgi:hypothetical protein